MSHKAQGLLGEAEAIRWFCNAGYQVFLPLGEPSNCDLVVEKDNKLFRVEVKHSQYEKASGNYEVSLRTHGGNKSWSGVIKRIDSQCTELLFVHTPVGNFLFPATEVDGMSSITVGTNARNQYKV